MKKKLLKKLWGSQNLKAVKNTSKYAKAHTPVFTKASAEKALRKFQKRGN